MDLAAIPMRPDGQVFVTAAVARGVDVVHVKEPNRFEELRVLYDASAARTAECELRYGPGFAGALRARVAIPKVEAKRYDLKRE